MNTLCFVGKMDLTANSSFFASLSQEIEYSWSNGLSFLAGKIDSVSEVCLWWSLNKTKNERFGVFFPWNTECTKTWNCFLDLKITFLFPLVQYLNATHFLFPSFLIRPSLALRGTVWRKHKHGCRAACWFAAHWFSAVFSEALGCWSRIQRRRF